LIFNLGQRLRAKREAQKRTKNSSYGQSPEEFAPHVFTPTSEQSSSKIHSDLNGVKTQYSTPFVSLLGDGSTPQSYLNSADDIETLFNSRTFPYFLDPLLDIVSTEKLDDLADRMDRTVR
jgi:hypothetical protein